MIFHCIFIYSYQIYHGNIKGRRYVYRPQRASIFLLRANMSIRRHVRAHVPGAFFRKIFCLIKLQSHHKDPPIKWRYEASLSSSPLLILFLFTMSVLALHTNFDTIEILTTSGSHCRDKEVTDLYWNCRQVATPMGKGPPRMPYSR